MGITLKLEILLITFSAITNGFESSTTSPDTFKSLQRSEVPFAKKQLQIIQLFNNLNCVKTKDRDLVKSSKTFDPLKNLNLYSNPDVIKTYFQKLADGDNAPRLDTFYFTDEQLAEFYQFFDIIWHIDDWDLLFNTTAYAVTRMNTQEFNWAFTALLASKPEYLNLKIPVSFEVFPQCHTPKWIVRKANGKESPNTVKSDPEDALRYWRNDPTLSQFHFNWHAAFPWWWLEVDYGVIKEREGELFMYIHHQIMNRNKAERLSNNMDPVTSLVLDKPIPLGDIPVTLNVDLTEMTARKRNSLMQDIPGVPIRDLQGWETRIRAGIEEGYFVNTAGEEVSLRNDSGNTALGAALEATEQSADYDYYGDLHNLIHLVISDISDPNGTLGLVTGIQAHPEQSMQDPVFYMVHSYVSDFDKSQQFRLPRYKNKDFEFAGVHLNSFRIANNEALGLPILKTFFEDFTYDITNSIHTCKEINAGKKATVTIRRLNYKPFEYKISVFSDNSKNTRGIIRIFMSPIMDFSGRPFSRQDLFWNMFEMDRFPVTLKRGRNEIRRSSKDSSVTVPDRLGFQELIKEVRKSVAENGKLDPYPYNMTRLCGWPQNLLLPRGTKEGMRFKMFVMLTSASTGDYDESQFPSLPLCGNPTGRFPDGVPMGFPFNRRIERNSLNIGNNYRFIDLIIQHQ